MHFLLKHFHSFDLFWYISGTPIQNVFIPNSTLRLCWWISSRCCLGSGHIFNVPSIVILITFLTFSIVSNLPPVRIEIDLVRLLIKIFFSELPMIKCWKLPWTETASSLIVSSMSSVLTRHCSAVLFQNFLRSF